MVEKLCHYVLVHGVTIPLKSLRETEKDTLLYIQTEMTLVARYSCWNDPLQKTCCEVRQAKKVQIKKHLLSKASTPYWFILVQTAHMTQQNVVYLFSEVPKPGFTSVYNFYLPSFGCLLSIYMNLTVHRCCLLMSHDAVALSWAFPPT